MPESDADAARVAANPLAERVQIGARIEKRMVKVLKGLAEYLDMSLGDLLEGIVLHAFESKPPFSAETLRRIQQLKEVYGMDYDASASHMLPERAAPEQSERSN
jgi:hypothetical protein